MYIHKIIMTFVSSTIVAYGTMSFSPYFNATFESISYWQFGSWYVAKLEVAESQFRKDLEWNVNAVMLALYLTSIIYLATPGKFSKEPGIDDRE